jgi:hypothetical protein
MRTEREPPRERSSHSQAHITGLHPNRQDVSCGQQKISFALAVNMFPPAFISLLNIIRFELIKREEVKLQRMWRMVFVGADKRLADDLAHCIGRPFHVGVTALILGPVLQDLHEAPGPWVVVGVHGRIIQQRVQSVSLPVPS